jgi:hypothetical protein
MTNLDIIREACERAHGHELTDARGISRPIRLADVLLAIEPWFGESPDEGKMITEKMSDVLLIIQYWNLRADDLLQQSEETLNLIAAALHDTSAK